MVLNQTTIQIKTRTQTGKDALNHPIYSEVWEDVSGCVVGSPSSEDIENEMNLSGKRIAYEVFLPNDDAHTWAGSEVKINNKPYRVIGDVKESFVSFSHIPCNKLISVEAYE